MNILTLDKNAKFYSTVHQCITKSCKIFNFVPNLVTSCKEIQNLVTYKISLMLIKD